MTHLLKVVKKEFNKTRPALSLIWVLKAEVGSVITAYPKAAKVKS